jgi:hypothetical protein
LKVADACPQPSNRTGKPIMESSPPKKKTAIVQDLKDVRRQIIETILSTPEEKMDQPFLGIWTLKDLLAQLVGWDISNLDAIKNLLTGQLPAFFLYVDKDWQEYNAQLAERYREQDFQVLLQALIDSHIRLLEFVEGLPDEVFEDHHGVEYKGNQITISRLLEIEAQDERARLSLMRAFSMDGVEN